MKRWISVTSHLFAFGTSFVTLSVVPIVVYGAIALERAWETASDLDSASVSMVAVPVLSALAAATFSATVAPLLSLAGQKITRRFSWNGLMFPLLVACAATVGFSLANALCALGWSSLAVIGAGAATGAALNAYWAPLGWAQRALPRLDEKCGRLRDRFTNQKPLVRIPLS